MRSVQFAKRSAQYRCRTPAWELRRRDSPHLHPDEWDFIEKVRRTGRVEVGALADVAAMDSYGNEFHSMRTAEARSVNADRSNSAFFNDEMMEYWHNKWAQDDAISARYAEIQRQENEKNRERYAQQAADREETRKVREEEDRQWREEQRRLERNIMDQLAQQEKSNKEWEAAGEELQDVLLAARMVRHYFNLKVALSLPQIAHQFGWSEEYAERIVHLMRDKYERGDIKI
jgi:hypothetical protein